MNGLGALGSLKRTIQIRLADVRQARFFHDRLSVGLLMGALLVNGLNLVALALRVRPTETLVPTRYSNLGGGFYALGPWYFPILIALIAAVITMVNGAMAFQSFSRSRLASFFLLSGSAVVAIFSFIISMAFGAIG
jgi:hypothetical protein